MTTWNERIQVQFGNAGEAMVLALAKTQGWHDVLKKGDRPSAVDFIFADENGKIVEIAEVKTRKAAFDLYDGVPAYAISNEQFTRNYEPILNAYLNVSFKLYIVDAEQGAVFSDSFDYQEFSYGGTYDDDGYWHQMPVVKTAQFGDKKVPLRYYAQRNFGEPVFDFSKTPSYEQLQILAERLTVDTIDDSPVEECSDFISAEDVISFVKFYASQSNSAGVEFGGWSQDFNHKYIGYYFSEKAVFVPLTNLKELGVKLTTIKKKERCRFDGWKGQFLDCAKLDDVLIRQDNPELWRWWNDFERSHFKRLCEAREFLWENFRLKLPADWGRLHIEGWNFDMRGKPLWFILDTVSALTLLVTTRHEYYIKKSLAEVVRKNVDQYRASKRAEAIPINKPAKKVHVIQTPDGTCIDVVSVSDRIFVNANQLGMACGYKNGACSGGTAFSRAVATSARFYKIWRPDKNKSTSFLAVDDVAKVLYQYRFTETRRERCKIGEELLKFWNGLNL